MGQQHRKIVKRRRRRDYLQRKKELALMEAAKPRLKRPAPVKAEAPVAAPAGEAVRKPIVKKEAVKKDKDDSVKKAPAKKPAAKKEAPLAETVDLTVVGAGPEPAKIEEFEKEIMPEALNETIGEALAEAEAVFLKE